MYNLESVCVKSRFPRFGAPIPLVDGFLHDNSLVELPKGKRALRNKWVYKLKPGDGGNPPRYKARIVVKGFQQKKGIDFDEIFAPVVKMTSI